MPSIQQHFEASDLEMSLTLVGPNIVLAVGPLIVSPVRRSQDVVW